MEDNISEQGLKTRLLWLERAATLYDQYDYAYRHGMCRGESECGMCYFMRKVALEEPEVIKLIDTETEDGGADLAWGVLTSKTLQQLIPNFNSQYLGGRADVYWWPTYDHASRQLAFKKLIDEYKAKLEAL